MLSIVVSRRSGISSGFGGSAAGTDRPMWALRLKSVISDDMRENFLPAAAESVPASAAPPPERIAPCGR